MLQTIKGFDRQESNAHWLLLSKFIYPRKPDDFANDIWKDVLGELPKRAIERFAKEGLVKAANLFDTLSCRYGGAELKEMLRQRGLPVSGRKDVMIQRLVDADPEHLKK